MTTFLTNLITLYILLYIIRVLVCILLAIISSADELKEVWNIHNMKDVLYFVGVPLYLYYHAYKIVENKFNKIN